VQELRDLVIGYVKQETVEPIKGLGRYIGFGIGGAILIGLGVMFLAVGSLRMLQGTDAFDGGNAASLGAYAIVLVGLVLLAALAWKLRGRAQRALSQSSRSDR
jgi:hypothetical protein